MRLYESVFIARQDISSAQVDPWPMNSPASSPMPVAQSTNVNIGTPVPCLSDQEEP